VRRLKIKNKFEDFIFTSSSSSPFVTVLLNFPNCLIVSARREFVFFSAVFCEDRSAENDRYEITFRRSRITIVPKRQHIFNDDRGLFDDKEGDRRASKFVRSLFMFPCPRFLPSLVTLLFGRVDAGVPSRPVIDEMDWYPADEEKGLLIRSYASSEHTLVPLLLEREISGLLEACLGRPRRLSKQGISV